MGMFQQVEGDCVVLVEGGVYKQTDLYIRDDYLYAKAAGGFVRLYRDGSTSKARCRIETISYTPLLHTDKFGRLCSPSVPHTEELKLEHKTKLLGGVT